MVDREERRLASCSGIVEGRQHTQAHSVNAESVCDHSGQSTMNVSQYLDVADAADPPPLIHLLTKLEWVLM